MVDRQIAVWQNVVEAASTPWARANSGVEPGPAQWGTPAWRPHGGWVLTVAAGLFALGCSGPAPPPGHPAPVTLTIGVPQSRQIDPTHNLSRLLSGWAFERLTSHDQQGRPAPRLVERWTESPDGLTWRLTVRAGVVYQDGTPLTNAAVRDAIAEEAASLENRAFSVCLPDITGVTADGEHDVIVRLTRRCYYLLDDLDVVMSRPGPGEARIGTGPFAIVSSSANELVLAANPRYYLGPPAIGRIVGRSYDTLRTAWAEMMRGQVDFLWEVGPDTAEFLRDQAGIESRTFPAFYCPSIVFNSRRPALRDAAVRRAMSLAVDRPELVQQGLRGLGVPADAPVWPNYWAFDRAAPGVPFDQGQARALLAARTRRPVTFTCLLPENYTLFERLALLVQRQLRSAGVEMKLEALPAEQFIARVGRGDFDAVMINPAGGPYAVVHRRFWHSPDPFPRWNNWGYRNAAVDAALDAMRSAPDDDSFRDAMARFVRAIREDPPALFLVWPDTVQAISRRFELPAAAAGRDALHVVAAWRVRQEASR